MLRCETALFRQVRDTLAPCNNCSTLLRVNSVVVCVVSPVLTTSRPPFCVPIFWVFIFVWSPVVTQCVLDGGFPLQLAAIYSKKVKSQNMPFFLFCTLLNLCVTPIFIQAEYYLYTYPRTGFSTGWLIGFLKTPL